jgi:hypothetical protein
MILMNLSRMKTDRKNSEELEKYPKEIPKLNEILSFIESSFQLKNGDEKNEGEFIRRCHLINYSKFWSNKLAENLTNYAEEALKHVVEKPLTRKEEDIFDIFSSITSKFIHFKHNTHVQENKLKIYSLFLQSLSLKDNTKLLSTVFLNLKVLIANLGDDEFR